MRAYNTTLAQAIKSPLKIVITATCTLSAESGRECMRKRWVICPHGGMHQRALSFGQASASGARNRNEPIGRGEFASLYRPRMHGGIFRGYMHGSFLNYCITYALCVRCITSRALMCLSPLACLPRIFVEVRWRRHAIMATSRLFR